MIEPVADVMSRSLPSRTTAAAIAAWITAFLALLLAVAAITGAQPGSQDAPPLNRLGRELVPNNSNARPAGNAMTITNRRDAPLVIIALGALPFNAASYGRVIVDADPVPPGVDVALIWVRQDQPGRPLEQRLERDGARILPTTLDRNVEWREGISFVAIGVKGAMQRPWSIHAVRLEPLGTGGVVADILQSWTVVERWDGRSINVVFGGRDEQRVWLPPFAFAASVIAALSVWLASRRRGSRASGAALALPFLIGWLALDLRWQSSLVEQARLTWSEFAGRDLDERHLAMEDGDLYRFAKDAMAKLPDAPVRIFVTSDYEYFRRRAGYHLYPHNVLAYDWADPSLTRPGEYVFLYQKGDVGYDTGRRMLLWKHGSTLPVTPLLVQRGAGLFKVRAPDDPTQ